MDSHNGTPPTVINVDDIEIEQSIHAPKDIPIEKLIALRKKNLSIAQIAKLCGCSPANVYKRLDKIDALGDYKENKADVLHLLQGRLLEAVNDQKVNRMSGKDLVVSVAILQDKITDIEQGRIEPQINFNVQINNLDEQIKALERRQQLPVTTTSGVEDAHNLHNQDDSQE